MRLCTLAGLALLLAACQQPAATTSDTENAFSADSMIAQMERAVNAGQADSVAAGYLADGIHVNSDSVLQGREAIANFWRTPEGVTATIDLDVDNQVVSGDLAYAEGTWVQRVTPPGGQEQTARGNWGAVYRHTEDGWRVYRSLSYMPRGASNTTAAADTTR